MKDYDVSNIDDIFVVPVVWEEGGAIVVRGPKTEEEAYETVQKHKDDMNVTLPVVHSYIEDTFRLTCDDKEEAVNIIRHLTKVYKATHSYLEEEPIYVFDEHKKNKQRTLKDVLDDELSADNMGNYTPNELADFLVKNHIVDNAADMNRIVIEGIQKAMIDDDEFPIHYYPKEEPMRDSGKYVDPGECLTDGYIDDNFNN